MSVTEAPAAAEAEQPEELEVAAPSPGQPQAAPASRRDPRLVRPKSQRTPLPAPFFVIISALLSLSALALWAVLYGFVLSSVQENRTQKELFATFRSQLVDGTAPVGGKIRQGIPVAMLQIPALNLHNLMVVEGTTSGDMMAGPGHRRDTPLPGEVGASFILGRGLTFGAPFGHIGRLKKGDTITVDTEEGTFKFVVDVVRRPGDSMTLIEPGASRLTLVTSEAAKGGARQVVYVDATTKDKAAPAPKGLLTALPAAEKQMKGDPGAFLAVVVWLEALIVALVAIAWARARWALVPTLLVGFPVVLAVVWGLTETVTRILPNLV